jgi:hypothetical protein
MSLLVLVLIMLLTMKIGERRASQYWEGRFRIKEFLITECLDLGRMIVIPLAISISWRVFQVLK